MFANDFNKCYYSNNILKLILAIPTERQEFISVDRIRGLYR